MEIDSDQLLLGDWPQRNKIVALGSNTPVGPHSSIDVLRLALRSLEAKGLTVDKCSRFYKTPCFPPGTGPDYVNAAAVVSGEPYPEAVLATIHDIESDYGRVREKRWASRGLDIDLLAAGDAILPDQETLLHWMELPLERQSQEAPAELLLPHPRLHERAFVLVPMADVAPNWRHPVLNRTVREMLSDLPDAERRAIVPLDDQSWP